MSLYSNEDGDSARGLCQRLKRLSESRARGVRVVIYPVAATPLKSTGESQ